jgi:hypothetical protein
MKLHANNLIEADIRAALNRARAKGRITGGTDILVLERQKSRSHTNGFEVRIGVDYHDGTHKRRNMDNSAYAATWEEWGWFIVELFMAEEGIKFGRTQISMSSTT